MFLVFNSYIKNTDNVFPIKQACVVSQYSVIILSVLMEHLTYSHIARFVLYYFFTYDVQKNFTDEDVFVVSVSLSMIFKYQISSDSIFTLNLLIKNI